MHSRHRLRRRQWNSTPVLLPGKSHGRRSLVGYSPWGREESDMTKRLYFHFSLSWIGEGNGNPLQYSCLENPRDRGACWAAVYGVAQSRTWLMRLSSSSSSKIHLVILLALLHFTSCLLKEHVQIQLDPRIQKDSLKDGWLNKIGITFNPEYEKVLESL